MRAQANDSVLSTNLASELRITAGPYLQAISETNITILWTTSHKSVSKVEYAAVPDGPILTAVQSQHGLIDANVTLHRVTLDGLKPGTRYRYRVLSTEIRDFQAYKVIYGNTVRSPEAQFATLDRANHEFSFLVLNDRHEKAAQLAQALRSNRWDNVDLVFFNGDMLNYGVNETQVLQKLIEPATQAFAGRIPFFLVRGNHETRGSFARQLMDYFPTPTGRYFHAFTHGGVRFVILDSGEDKSDTSPEYSGLVRFEPYIDEETRWLQQEIRSRDFRKALFRVVFSHMPPHPMIKEPFVRGKYLLDHWGPLFNRGNIDLLLCAHTHRYSEVKPHQQNNNYPIVINGTDSVIRVDTCKDYLNVTTFNDDGSLKSKLPAIKRR